MTSETELKKLLNEIMEFVKIVESKKNYVEDILGKLKENVRIIHSQLETYTISKRASVPSSMLKKLPDVKQRLLSKLYLNIDKEIRELTRNVNEMIAFKEELRRRSNKIENLAANIMWKENRQFFYGSCRLVEWVQGCWKYFSLIYVLNFGNLQSLLIAGHFELCTNLQVGLTTLRMDHDTSNRQLEYKDTFNGLNKEFVFSNREAKMLKMMLLDVSSRSKISVKSVKPATVTE